jgi:hypothetical protein
MKSPLTRFLIILLLILITIELLVRANGKYFYALSDSMLLNAKILEREPETKILFLGTSRFLDAIDHHLFTKELAIHTGVTLKSLNAATTGLQNERLAWFSEVAVANPGLTHVIIEASPPAMGSDGKLNFPGQNSPAVDSAETARFPDRFENRLQSWVMDHIALATYRKALRPKTLIKLFVLHTANFMDPNVWSRKRPLQSIFFPVNEEVTPQMIANREPAIVAPGPTPATVPSGETFANLKKIADIFQSHQLKVIWVAPPVSSQQVSANHNPLFTSYYQTISNHMGATFYDYAGQGWEEKYLRDPSHLGPRGRNVFTKMLAAHLARYLWSEKNG